MLKFSAVIQKYSSQGEKTGWSFVLIPEEMAGKLKPGNKKSFRVKGKLDEKVIEQQALIPIGGGDFILPLKADLRKKLGKGKGDTVNLQLWVDERALEISADLLTCLEDEPKARENFQNLPPSHQQYYSKWIESARTDATRAKRIAQTVNAMARGLTYGEMIREGKM
ncbi:YdeI/OmpD-associated family protein [Flavihumibacter rivuli]|uniref:YdeI/OmpD-associated family protein n=1 Tax=Flavihumibacter rivuli TaxID=2838156 RepID=UPI001BDE976D|nr:YdeI/OmpD-associated family protein [Flavihumibacter rivuli]ULQ57356.1 YdeI/OmpD-associated family protein [Flavihumibacter rivuli]